ncbi:MAG TPA: M1 family aminopeptidase, partial [Thermoanaerobaculia bacterium]|nr:M1 family aminopeptidase [Thermoanaerobaculia bacterium]
MNRSTALPSSVLALVLASLFALPPAHAAGEPDPAALQRELAASRLDLERAVTLKKVKLDVGLATLHLEDGILVPAVAAGMEPAEMVFLGKGRIEMAAPDEVEAGQLELFTGAPRLDESFTEAVLVVGSDAAATALLRKPAAAPEEAARRRVDALWGEWRKSREREIFNVDRALLLDALKDPLGAGYFGAWFRGGAQGDFLYLVQPDDQEQVTLGRFVPLDATEKEKRKLERVIRKEQRKGRLVGMEVEDIGEWDTWAAAALRDSSGQPASGTPAFEPTKYTLDIRLTEPGLRLSGKARIDLQPVLRGSRVVGMSLSRDFVVSRVTDGDGRELFFHRGERELTVILPAPPADGKATTVIVDYAGSPVGKSWNLTALVTTVGWYPRAGLIDRASYEATFHWPKGFDLVAGGRRVDGGQEADGTRWERRVLEVPSQDFSFEVGHFDVETAQAGHIRVTFAFGSAGVPTSRSAKEEVKRTVVDALSYFEEVFGPYPLDELTVAIVPRDFSQGLLGFVTLAGILIMGDSDWIGFSTVEDRRLVVAHEIAHQWWGNQVGWTSYRDQWISEAMASYSATLYARDRLKEKELSGDLTANWREDLSLSAANGRPVESLGPVVLGSRLDSSLADDAYQLIVYKKGAVVLEMLARLLGEENFPKILRQVVKASAGKSISTADLFWMIETVAATELDEFARLFVYGTGLPEFFYTYHFEKNGNGWNVKGQVRQETPYEFRYKVTRTGRGAWDVRGEGVPRVDVQKSMAVVPVEIAVYNPAQKKGKGKDGANEGVRGHALLKGESIELAFAVEHEPKGFWLDPRARVWSLFYDESRDPKLALYSQATKAAAAGRTEEAEKLYARALAIEEPAFQTGEPVVYRNVRWERSLLDALIEISWASLLMDLDRDSEADAAIGRARSVVRDSFLRDRIQARLEVRRGRYERAYQLLQRVRNLLDAQDYALLAIAARETGHAEEAAEALKKAR